MQVSAFGGSETVSTVQLRAARAERLLTIRELACLARVAPSTIHLIERGRASPRTRVMRAVASALGVSPHEIDEFRCAIELAKASVNTGPLAEHRRR